MRVSSILFCLSLFAVSGISQPYTSFLTGNPVDMAAIPEFGICLMGGATEQDDAMRWFLQRANGGDVVVIRATGSNGYNNYLYADLGVSVHSVETLVIPTRIGANDPYVRSRLRGAEAIWIAGGNQHTYVSEWKGTALDSALNDHMLVKKGVIGGTSAGMAILSQTYFQAANGTVSSSQALSNPFHPQVTLSDNFLKTPFLSQTINDSHYDNPNRKGRHVAFMARMATATGERSFGVGVDEYTAVCIDSLGKARVFGDFPAYDDNAFFLQASCDTPYLPEVCQPGQPLTWNRGGRAIRVYAVKGTRTGAHFFDLSDWKTGSGGVWEHWQVDTGVLVTTLGEAPVCETVSGVWMDPLPQVWVFPNPFTHSFTLEGLLSGKEAVATLFDLAGKAVYSRVCLPPFDTVLYPESLPTGVYALVVSQDGKTAWRRVQKF